MQVLVCFVLERFTRQSKLYAILVSESDPTVSIHVYIRAVHIRKRSGSEFRCRMFRIV